MNNRDETIRKLTELADSVMATKGKDYTAGNWETDSNYNFKEVAKLLQGAPINPYTVCMIYFLKHVFSLIKFCKTGKQEGGEGLEGRHVDALNYVRILWTLIEEARIECTPVTSRKDLDITATAIVNPCNCPACRRVRIEQDREAQDRNDWLDRVNEQ